MKNDEIFNEFVDLVKIVNKMEQSEIENVTELVNEMIKYRYKDERIISEVFDKMLSLVFVSEDDIKGIYYKLLNYTKKFNKELSEDYEQIFIEHFNDVDDV